MPGPRSHISETTRQRAILASVPAPRLATHPTYRCHANRQLCNTFDAIGVFWRKSPASLQRTTARPHSCQLRGAMSTVHCWHVNPNSRFWEAAVVAALNGRGLNAPGFQFTSAYFGKLQYPIAAGPRITINKTGKKNKIIGTVSLGGNEAAFASASDCRISRFSLAIVLSAAPTGVP